MCICRTSRGLRRAVAYLSRVELRNDRYRSIFRVIECALLSSATSWLCWRVTVSGRFFPMRTRNADPTVCMRVRARKRDFALQPFNTSRSKVRCTDSSWRPVSCIVSNLLDHPGKLSRSRSRIRRYFCTKPIDASSVCGYICNASDNSPPVPASRSAALSVCQR